MNCWTAVYKWEEHTDEIKETYISINQNPPDDQFMKLKMLVKCVFN